MAYGFTRALAILFTVAGVIVLAGQPARAYPSYQCFKSNQSGDYCSCKKVNNHDEGNEWIKQVTTALNLTVNGKPWESAKLPEKATWWPKPCKG